MGGTPAAAAPASTQKDQSRLGAAGIDPGPPITMLKSTPVDAQQSPQSSWTTAGQLLGVLGQGGNAKALSGVAGAVPGIVQSKPQKGSPADTYGGAAEYAAIRIGVFLLGLVFIGASLGMFAVGAVVRAAGSPAGSTIVGAGIVGRSLKKNPKVDKPQGGRPKGSKNTAFELDIEGKKVPLKKKREKKGDT